MRSDTGRVSCNRQGTEFHPCFLSSLTNSSSLARFWHGHHLRLSSLLLSSFLTTPTGCRELVGRTCVLPSSVVMTISILSCILVLGIACPAFTATWSPEMQVNVDDTSADWNPMVVCDSAGTAWVFWMGIDHSQGDFEIYYSRWTGDGWTSEERVHSDNVQKDAWPVACIGGDGIPWVVWERHRGGTSPYWDILTTHWVGSGWGEPETLYAGGSEGQVYDIACLDTNLVWVAMSLYVKMDGNYDKDLFFRKYEDGLWGTTERIYRPGVDDDAPSIAVSSQGVPWVLWSGGTVLATYRDSIGWKEPVFSKRGSYGLICFSGGRGPWVVFFDSTGNMASSFWDGQYWLDSGPIPSPHVIESEWDYRPAVSGLAVGGPVLVWPRADHHNVWRGDVYFSRWAGCWWKKEILVTEPDSERAAVDEWPDASVGAGGRTWVVWERCGFPDCADVEIWARYSDDVIYDPWVKSFSGRAEGRSVVLEWESADSIGFEIYRSDMGECGGREYEGERELLTAVPLIGRLSFVDTTVQVGRRYNYWLDVVSERGLCEEHGPVSVRLCDGAVRVGVVGVRPNPSGTGFMIGYYSGEKGRGQLEVLDISGRLVRRMVCSGIEGEVEWNGRDSTGKEVRPGIYFVRLLVGGREAGRVTKVVLLR